MSERSAQHGPRVDEELRVAVERHVRGTPVDSRGDDDVEVEPGDADAARSQEYEDDRHLELLARSEIARFLRPSALPADAMAIVAIAHEEHATEAVLDELLQLPRGVEFATVGEIWEALGHETEHRGDEPPDVVVEAVVDLVDAIVAEPHAPVTPPTDEQRRPVAPTSASRPEPSRPAWWSPMGVATCGSGVVRGAIGVANRAFAAARSRLLP